MAAPCPLPDAIKRMICENPRAAWRLPGIEEHLARDLRFRTPTVRYIGKGEAALGCRHRNIRGAVCAPAGLDAGAVENMLDQLAWAIIVQGKHAISDLEVNFYVGTLGVGIWVSFNSCKVNHMPFEWWATRPLII